MSERPMPQVELHWITIRDGPAARTLLRMARDGHTGPYFAAADDPRVEITREAAAELWPQLKHFAETGSAPPRPEPPTPESP